MNAKIGKWFFFSIFMAISGVLVAEPISFGKITFQPISHATFVILADSRTVVVDPVGKVAEFKKYPAPDLILVTHIHPDHLNKAVIDAIKTPDTKIVGPQSVISQIKEGTALGHGKKMTVGDVMVEAVPAYNLTPDRLAFHPRERSDNGYVVTISGKRIYISGDTEDIPEMRQLKSIDFAFVCMNLPYTMTVEQAASAVLAFKPKVVFPYHYRGKGGFSDLEKFKRLVGKDPSIQVKELSWY